MKKLILTKKKKPTLKMTRKKKPLMKLKKRSNKNPYSRRGSFA